MKEVNNTLNSKLSVDFFRSTSMDDLKRNIDNYLTYWDGIINVKDIKYSMAISHYNEFVYSCMIIFEKNDV